MQNLSPSQRQKAWTSETAIAFSKGFNKIAWDKVELSPVQIEHMVKGYLGYVGGLALNMADLVTRPVGGFAGKPSWRIEDYPLAGAFLSETPSRHTKYAAMFYKQLKAMNSTYADIQNFRMLGEAEKAMNLFKKERDTLKFRKLANKMQKNISRVTKQIRLTRLNKNLTKDEKRARMDNLTVIKTKLLKMAVERISN